MLEAKTDKQFTSTDNMVEVSCWGIFKTPTYHTPKVYCYAFQTAERMVKAPTYIHYNSNYRNYTIRKITKLVPC